MRRYLPRLLLTSALLSPMSVWALGLGDIRLNSALNQPFDAEIELLSPTPEELQSLKVGLASTDVFSRYGIDRPAYLSNFNFAVGRSRDGRATIKVRSNRSVTEPFVTLLVEASWGSGRLVREYTVLLDPPVFMPSQSQAPAPVTTPQAGAQTEGRIERAPQPQEAPQSQPEPTAPASVPAPQASESEPIAPSQTASSMSGEYAVQRNDTLWRIASQISPGSPREVNRTMIALFQANPAAFDGNINRLRAGAVLRVPEFAEIEAISTAEATAEVARQTSEWSASLPTATTEEVARLRLVTPEEAPTPPTVAPSTVTEPTPATPATPTAGTTSEQDRRLSVESPDLAGVQEGVDESAQTEAPVEAPVAEELVAEEPGVTAEEPAPVAEQPAAPARARRAPPAEPVAEPSLLDRLGDFWWVAVLLGLLAVLGIFIRKRRQDTNSLDSLDSVAPLDYEPPARRSAVMAKAREPEPFVNDEETADVMDAPMTARRSEAPATRPIEPVDAPEQSIDDTLSSDTAIRLDQQDALAEADFHMAYGLYDQAADLVKIAIDREPGRRDLKLKLLEIYFVWGNKELFLDTARDLHSTRDEAAAGEWDKVLIMGKQIAPDDSMFKGEAGAAHVDLVDVNLEGGENRVDVDLFAEPEGDQPAGLDLEFASGERKSPESASDLDFLLDEPGRGDDEDSTRELDPLARTQETPTIESPMLDRRDATIREQADTSEFSKLSAEQTAEISLDDLGLDAEAVDHSGALEETTSIEKDAGDTIESARPIRDDEMTQLAPSLSSFDRTMEAPRVEKFDVESTGTIYIDQVDLSTGDTIEQPRKDIDATASMKAPEIDLDLDNLDDVPARGDTVRTARPIDNDNFGDVFTGSTGDTANIDLDVGDAMVSVEDRSPTTRQAVNEMELSELEPVTMSEVGTKLDLARAYMDMGDPDGARSILEEVMQEGNQSQKQEANRLLESIR